MESIGEVVRNVAMVVILASVIELLLPGQEMGRYVRLIMGMFVIVAVLFPLVQWLDQDLAFEVTAWQVPTPPSANINTILEKGNRIQANNQEMAIDEYRRRLERQMQAMVQLIPAVTAAEVIIEINTGEPRTVGQIRKVQVIVETGEPGGKTKQSPVTGVEVSPIIIGNQRKEAGEKGQDDSKLITMVVSTLVNFYGLQPEQVSVIVVHA